MVEIVAKLVVAFMIIMGIYIAIKNDKEPNE
mgnify:CR=1 FL=1